MFHLKLKINKRYTFHIRSIIKQHYTQVRKHQCVLVLCITQTLLLNKQLYPWKNKAYSEYYIKSTFMSYNVDNKQKKYIREIIFAKQTPKIIKNT